MARTVGTIVRGIRTPMIKAGDNIVDITVDAVLAAAANENFELRNRDVVCIKESIVARAQGNYAHLSQIGADIKRKIDGHALFFLFSAERFHPAEGIAESNKNP